MSGSNIRHADISTLEKTGHFYFGLTAEVYYCSAQVVMSGLTQVKMSALQRSGDFHVKRDGVNEYYRN